MNATITSSVALVSELCAIVLCSVAPTEKESDAKVYCLGNLLSRSNAQLIEALYFCLAFSSD